MGKASFSSLGSDLETMAKCLKAIQDFPPDFLIGLSVSQVFRNAIKETAENWALELVKDKFANYPYSYSVGCDVIQHREDLPHNCLVSDITKRHVTPEMLKTRNILNSAVTVCIHNDPHSARVTHQIIILIDGNRVFHWDCYHFRTDKDNPKLIGGGSDNILSIPFGLFNKLYA